MLKLSKVLILLFCAILFTAVSIFAEPVLVTPAVAPEFQSLDINGDTTVNHAEIQIHQVNKFAELDKDKSGHIDTEELKADDSKMFHKADKDNDGKITQEEARIHFSEYFNQFDNNKDGKIDAQEYSNNWKSVIYF